MEISEITNKATGGGKHRQLWWVWVADEGMAIQTSIWAPLGEPRGEPPMIPRLGEVIAMTGFTGINHNGIYDKWHTCQLQAEQRTVRFEYPGVDATLLWDRPLNPNRTLQVPRTPRIRTSARQEFEFLVFKNSTYIFEARLL